MGECYIIFLGIGGGLRLVMAACRVFGDFNGQLKISDHVLQMDRPHWHYIQVLRRDIIGKNHFSREPVIMKPNKTHTNRYRILIHKVHSLATKRFVMNYLRIKIPACRSRQICCSGMTFFSCLVIETRF